MTDQTKKENQEEPNGESESVNLADAAAENEIPVQMDESEGNPSGDASAKAQDFQDKYTRICADFDNFKKRVSRERMETAKYANSNLIMSLLPVLDNLESAVVAAEKSGEDGLQSLKQGVSMVSQQFKNALKEVGLVEVDAAGQEFDPNFHEAVSQVESSEVPEGHVVEQLRKGYQLHERLLRAATVVVAKAPEASTDTDEVSSS